MDLNNAIEFDKLNPSLTVISSLETDGSFLLHNLLAKTIRQKHGIIFLTFSQKMSHYKSIQNKLANSNALATQMDSGEFSLIDCMQISKKMMSKKHLKTDADATSPLNQIVSNVKKLTDKFDFANANKKHYVDDLSVAHLIGIDDYALLEFINKIRAINENIHLVVYVQCFESNQMFISELLHLSDLYVRLDKLQTGYSKEIDGQVR